MSRNTIFTFSKHCLQSSCSASLCKVKGQRDLECLVHPNCKKYQDFWCLALIIKPEVGLAQSFFHSWVTFMNETKNWICGAAWCQLFFQIGLIHLWLGTGWEQLQEMGPAHPHHAVQTWHTILGGPSGSFPAHLGSGSLHVMHAMLDTARNTWMISYDCSFRRQWNIHPFGIRLNKVSTMKCDSTENIQYLPPTMEVEGVLQKYIWLATLPEGCSPREHIWVLRPPKFSWLRNTWMTSWLCMCLTTRMQEKPEGTHRRMILVWSCQSVDARRRKRRWGGGVGYLLMWWWINVSLSLRLWWIQESAVKKCLMRL